MRFWSPVKGGLRHGPLVLFLVIAVVAAYALYRAEHAPRGLASGGRTSPEFVTVGSQEVEAPPRLRPLRRHGNPIAGSASDSHDRAVSPSDVRVLVTDERGSGLAGADVFVCLGGEVLASDTTDESGRARLADPRSHDHERAVLVSRKLGYSTKTAYVTSSTQEADQRIVMDAECAISGRVVLPPAPLLHEAIRVLAIPANVVLRERTGVSAEATDPRLADCAAEADGSFTLRGLRCGATYQLVAASQGWCGRASTCTEAPCADVRIDLRPVYGALVRAIDSAGKPVRQGGGLSHSSQVSTSWALPSGVRSIRAGAASARLAGLGYLQQYRGEGTGGRALLVTTAEPRQRVGPIPYRFQVPGYRPVTVDLWLERVGGALKSYDVRVVPLQHLPNVTMQFVLSGMPSMGADAHAARETVGALVLRQDDGGEFYVPVEAGMRRVRVTDLPAGPYRVRFQPKWYSWGGGLPDGWEALYIDGSLTETAIEAPVWGSASIRIDHPSGHDLGVPEGRVEFVAVPERRHPRARDAFTVHLKSWRQDVHGIPPGLYRVTVRLTTVKGSTVVVSEEAEILAGTATRLEGSLAAPLQAR